jgi:dolichol-phosphate mannosyltransferase
MKRGMAMNIRLSIVIPVYNEEDNLSVLFQELDRLLPELRKRMGGKVSSVEGSDIEILFVNDGSTDNSADILESKTRESIYYRQISFSRNFGHQAAVSAGLRFARGDAVVVMDGDLQDPPELIKEMAEKWMRGFDVVYAVRKKREAPLLKKTSYSLYYRLKAAISDFPVQKDSGDFSLLDRKVVNSINSLPEKERYVRGLRAWVGFKQTELEYERIGRKKGKSKYSLLSLIKLAFHGVISTSVKPLFLSGLFIILSIFIILGIIGYSILSKIFIPENVMPKGWTSLMVTMSVLSGFQLISVWLLSLYIARIYREILGRPTYLVAHDSLEQKENADNEDKRKH